jgi:DNA-binding CsgD family transcriptional regulator
MTAPHQASLSVAQQLNEVSRLGHLVPGVVMVHDLTDFSIVYMNQTGLDILGLSLEALVNMKTEYYSRYFSRDDEELNIPKVTAMLQRNQENELIAMFQPVRSGEQGPWVWYCTSLKVLIRDADRRPLYTIAVAIPIDPEHHLSNKISRLLSENDFLRKHHDKFSKLTRQEKKVLARLATGFSSVDIAQEMHISPFTADTHRRNIKKKLGTSNTYELAQYAHAFDLI